MAESGDQPIDLERGRRVTGIESESQYRPHEDFTLRTCRASGVNDATRTANESHIRVHENRQPFSLNLEGEMATGIEPDPASDSKRETREADVCTAGNMCTTNAGQYERPGPGNPVFDQRLMAEVCVKLIKNHALTGRLGSDVLRVDIRVLPCPAYFDQVIFIFEPHTKGTSIARARIEYNARVHRCDMGLNRKTHAGAITDEWSEIKTHWLWFRLLRAESGRERNQQHREESK